MRTSAACLDETFWQYHSHLEKHGQWFNRTTPRIASLAALDTSFPELL